MSSSLTESAHERDADDANSDGTEELFSASAQDTFDVDRTDRVPSPLDHVPSPLDDVSPLEEEARFSPDSERLVAETTDEAERTDILPDEQLTTRPVVGELSGSEHGDSNDDRVTMTEPHEAIKDQHSATVIDSILKRHSSDSQAGDTADGAFDFGAMDYGDVREDQDRCGSPPSACAASLGGATMQAAVSEESIDLTESASLDSEDMEESYGDQQAELAEEMQVHIAPSPQPPQLAQHAESDDEAVPVESLLPAAMPLRADLRLEIRESKPEPSHIGMLKKMGSLSSEDIVKTSSSSDTSAEPTLLAATYDLETGAISRVVATYDISPDSVEKTLIGASHQPKALLSSPEDEVFEFDSGEVRQRGPRASDDSTVCEVAVTVAVGREADEMAETEKTPEAADDMCGMAEAEPEETEELQAIGGVKDVDSEESETERVASPFEIVSYQDVSGCSDDMPQDAVSPHVTFDPSVPTEPAGSVDDDDDESRRPKLSLVEEESPSFEHSSPISSSEPSDFHGPISPFDVHTLEQLPDVSAEAEYAAAQPEPDEEPEAAGRESHQPEEGAYIYTNGPTEVDYCPEHDILFRMPAQPQYQASAPHEVDLLMLDPEEHSSSETEIQPESESGDLPEDIAAAELLQQSPTDERVPLEEPSFLTESLREDVQAPDSMMSSDHTLYDLEMPVDEAAASQASGSVAVAQSLEQHSEPFDPDQCLVDVTETSHDVFEAQAVGDDYEVPTPVSGRAALESEAMAQMFTAPVDVDAPPEYDYGGEDLQGPSFESEHRSSSLEEELAQSQLEGSDASDNESVKDVGSEETPEPELVALAEEAADAEASSNVHFAPVQTDEPDQQFKDDAAEMCPDQFELHVDACDIERPRSPVPENACTFWPDEPEDDENEEDEPHIENSSCYDQMLQETANEFVDDVLREAQCVFEAEQLQVEEGMHDEDTEYEVTDASTVQLGKQMSDDIPEITVTQHLTEEAEDEDEPVEYTVDSEQDNHTEPTPDVEVIADDVVVIADDVEAHSDLMGFEDDSVPEQAICELEMTSIETEEIDDRQEEEDVQQSDSAQEKCDDETLEDAPETEHDSVQPETLFQAEETSVDKEDESQPHEEAPFLDVDCGSKVEEVGNVEPQDTDDEQNDTDHFLEVSPTPMDEKGDDYVEYVAEEEDGQERKGSYPFLVKGLDARMPKEIGECVGIESSSSGSDNEVVSDEDGGEEMEVDAELFVNIGYGMSELATIEEERSSIESGTTSSGSHNERVLPETPEEVEELPPAIGEKTQESPSPVHSGVSETDSDHTSSADTCTVISNVVLDDQGDSSSVDSFATVVTAEQIEAYADSRLNEIASMTSSFTSDMQGSFHEELIPEPAISIDVRDKPSDVACDLDDHSPCCEKPDVLEVSRGESVPMRDHSEQKDVEFRSSKSKALTIKTSAHRDLRAYEKAESGKSSSSSSSERLESAIQSPGLSGQSFFNKSSERDDISITSSLLEFECMEQALQDRNCAEMFPPHALSPPQTLLRTGKVVEKDNISISSSLAEFEHMECLIAPSDSPHRKLSPTQEDSGSVTSLNEFENLETACQSRERQETYSTASTLSLHADFDRLEDDELQAEAQKVVSLLESGSLLPCTQVDRDTAVDPSPMTWVISSEKLIEPPDMSIQEASDDDRLVPQMEDDSVDHDSPCEGGGHCGPDIDQIIREASDNVQGFAADIQMGQCEETDDSCEAQTHCDIGVENIGATASHMKDIDDDSLDGRDDHDYKHKRPTDMKLDDAVVPAPLHTPDVEADSLQDSDVACRSGLQDTDSLHDTDSIMAISAESFEFDQPTESFSKAADQERPAGDSSTVESEAIAAIQKTDDPMKASADSLEGDMMHRSADSDNIMQKSVDSEGAMHRSVDSLNVETCGAVISTEVMRDSLEGMPSSVSRDSLEQDATMTTSVDSLELPPRDRRLTDVMLESTESGLWSQTSSETLKSSGTETEDIMQVSTDCPDFGPLDTIEDAVDENASEYQGDTTNTAFATLDWEGNLPADSTEQVDDEGNVRERTETATRPLSMHVDGKHIEQCAEGGAMYQCDTTPPRDDMDFTDCYNATKLQPSSSLTSPSTESSHSENCYCGPTLDAASSQLAQDDIMAAASPRGSRLTVLGVSQLSAWLLPQSSTHGDSRPRSRCCQSLIGFTFVSGMFSLLLHSSSVLIFAGFSTVVV